MKFSFTSNINLVTVSMEKGECHTSSETKVQCDLVKLFRTQDGYVTLPRSPTAQTTNQPTLKRENPHD